MAQELARLKIGDYYNNSSSTSLSFPSSFNAGGFNTLVEGSGDSVSQFKKVISQINNSHHKYVREQIPSMNIGGRPAHSNIDGLHVGNAGYNNIVYRNDVINTSQFNGRTPGAPLENYIKRDSGYADGVFHHHKYQSVYHLDTTALRQMNHYLWKWNTKTKTLVGSVKNQDKGSEIVISENDTSPALFNPNYNVSVVGMTANVPLLIGRKRNTTLAAELNLDPSDDISDCSIHKLVELTKKFKLGQINYRFADFMYCKDLGKVSNNYLITLRKFGGPVGDHLTHMNTNRTRKTSASDVGFDSGAEIGHLVTWFGTDDNKIEDILKYSYQYTWKQLNSKRQDMDSKEDDSSRGLIGKLANFNPSYHKQMNMGLAGNQSFWHSSLLGKVSQFAVNPSQGDQMDKLRMYDANKVYEPKQTIQDMLIPEGKLQFTHEFNLVFSYKLRAYEGINPKSAFLDLIGNIMRTTYFTGTFWGGSRNILGPQPNNASYRKMNAFIDKAFAKMGGGLAAIANGSLSMDDILGSLSSMVSDAYETAKQVVSGAADAIGSQGFAKYAAQKILQLDAKTDIASAVKGLLKNGLGRPSFYAFDSLLTGEDTGLWHVTIGNPRNPIAVMGNMILTNASIQHLGPLGLDDFPTELKVTVTLKHARSRDVVAIEKMYTQGLNSIYMNQQRNPLSDYYVGDAKFDESEIDTPYQEPKKEEKQKETTSQQQQNNSEEQTQAPPPKDPPLDESDRANEAHANRVESINDSILLASKNRVEDPGTAWAAPDIAITNAFEASLLKSGTDNIIAIKTAFDENESA